MLLKKYLLNNFTMLHIIAQYKQLVTSFIMNRISNNPEWWHEDVEKKWLTPEKKAKFLEHREEILDFDIESVNTKMDDPKVRKLQEKLKDLKINGEDSKELIIDWRFWKNTLHAIEMARGFYITHNLEEDRNPILAETQIVTEAISEERSEPKPEPKPETTVVLDQQPERIIAEDKPRENQEDVFLDENIIVEDNGQNIEKIQTAEVNESDLKSNFLWILSDIEASELRWMVNSKSLDKMLLSGININEFYNKLLTITNLNNYDEIKNSKWEIKGFYDFNPSNIWELKDEFKNQWYENKWFWFLWKEVWSLMEILENIVKTQKNIPGLWLKEKLGILIDFDKDWFLDNDVHFYVQEQKFLESIDNSEEFDSLLQNLGYAWWINDFDTQFSENYFMAREVFVKRLGYLLAIKPPIQPTELLTNQTAVKEYSELMMEIKTEISEGVNSHEKFKDFTPEQKDKITLEAVWLLVGTNFGIWASFNISELTNSWLDNAFVWIVNGIPWVGLSKMIYETDNKRFRLDAWFINFVPFWSARAVIKEWNLDEEQFKELFPDELDAWVKVVLWGTISSIWGWVFLDLKAVDERSIEWREKAKNQMSEVLDTVFKNIKDRKTFEESDFSSNENARVVYESISDYINNANLSPELIKEGTLTNYENDLSEGTEWLNFTWVWAWLVFISWYLPIPVILVHGNYNTRDWEKEKTVTISDLRNILSKEDNTQVVESEVVNESTKWIDSSNKALVTSVNWLDHTITFRTRTNKYADEIMNPDTTIDERWNWFVKFANRDLKYSKELNLTIDSFKSVLALIEKNWPISKNDKFYIISTVVQFMKKANDTDEWNIENYNKNYESLIKMNNDRRDWYNELLWFNTDIVSDKFDIQLRAAWEAWKIWETKTVWISFDASSSLRVYKQKEAMKGVDIFYSNIQVLTSWWKPILIPITNQKDIDWFVSMLENKNNLDEKIKRDLIEWIKSKNIELNYYRDPDWHNDRILPIIIKRPTRLNKNWNWTNTGWENGLWIDKEPINVYSLEVEQTDLVVAVTGRTEKKSDDDTQGQDLDVIGDDQAWAPDANWK